MEDIYGDLSNYEDVNCVQELRNENMELKVKLEEHSAAMEKLQKDYDTLEMEFRKLENNYSSLLKTARSEIERKTERISQLNIEKDNLVLNSLKNGKKINRNMKSALNANKLNNDKPIKVKKKNASTQVKEDDIKLKTVNAKTKRCDTPPVQIKDTVHNAGIDNRSNCVNKIDNAASKAESLNIRKSNGKENVTHHKTENKVKTIASSIKNRRKSMPVLSMAFDKFSSDEELEQNYNTKESKTDLTSLDRFERRKTHKISSDRHSIKTSETSSIDDRGSNYHESASRETRSRRSRKYDSCSYRDRDKYDLALRYRNHNSPERGQSRQLREYQDDYYRQDHGRYWSMESPPPPPESRELSRHQRRHPEPRVNYDRHSREQTDHNKYRHCHEEKYAAKHKMSNDYDEPHSKRQKRESNHDAYYKEDRKYHNARESVDVQSIPEFSPHEYDMMRQSCQSPDYELIDAAVAHPIKEIMATATTPLEDPRVKSKRYIIKKERGKELLSTTVGRNVDYKPVDKAVWGVDIPEALRRRPSQCSDFIVTDVYMDSDSDNSETNETMESGEVFSMSEDESLEIRNQAKGRHDIQDNNLYKKAIEESSKRANEERSKRTNKERSKRANVERSKRAKEECSKESNKESSSRADKESSKQATEECSKQADHVEQISKTTRTKYKIPKLAQNKNTHSKMDVPIIEVGANILSTDDVIERNVRKSDCSKKSSNQQHKIEKRDNVLPSTESYSKEKDQSDTHNQSMLSKMAIVADDLELSDENSDNLDTHTRIVVEKVEKRGKLHPNIKQGRKEGSKTNIENKSENASSHDNETDRSVALKTVAEDEMTKAFDRNKKQKNIKQRRKEDSYIENKSGNVSSHDNETDKSVQTITIAEDEKTKAMDISKKQKNKKQSRKEDYIIENKLGNASSQHNETDKSAETQTVADDEKTGNKKQKNMKQGRQEDSTSNIIENILYASIHDNEIKTVAEDEKNKASDSSKKHKNIKQIGKEELNIENKSVNSHEPETDRTVETKTVEEEEKIKESDSSKKKTKKKKSKSKDLIETTDNTPVPEKKTGPKKEKECKSKETNNKFSDLFGDSNSLMTPEDLGIPSYVPISEDAQNAVDMQINQIIDAPTAIDKEEITVENNIQKRIEIKNKEATTPEESAETVLLNTKTEDNEVIKEINKKKASKKSEEIVNNNEKSPNVVYQNLNPGTDSNEPDVVKTVIISTGVQPEITFENNREADVTKPAADFEGNAKQDITNINYFPTILELKRLDNDRHVLKALATSTPQKEFTPLKSMEADARTADFTCSSNVSKTIESRENAAPVVNQNSTNTSDPDTDVPDVRIFVKRRRKLVKRPPMT